MPPAAAPFTGYVKIPFSSKNKGKVVKNNEKWKLILNYQTINSKNSLTKLTLKQNKKKINKNPNN